MVGSPPEEDVAVLPPEEDVVVLPPGVGVVALEEEGEGSEAEEVRVLASIQC